MAKKTIFDVMREDEELMAARAEYTALTGKRPPGIVHETFQGWPKYKEDLLAEIARIKEGQSQKNT